jgi:hypothetical protein
MNGNIAVENLLYVQLDEVLSSINIIFSGKEDRTPDFEYTRKEIKNALMQFANYICRFNYLPQETLFCSIIFWSQYKDGWDSENIIYFVPFDRYGDLEIEECIKQFVVYNKFLANKKIGFTNFLFREILQILKHNSILIEFEKIDGGFNNRILIEFDRNIDELPKIIKIIIKIPSSENLFNFSSIQLTVDTTFGNALPIFKFPSSNNKEKIELNSTPNNIELEFEPKNFKKMINLDILPSLRTSLSLLGGISLWSNIYGLPAVLPLKGNLIGNGVLYVVLKNKNRQKGIEERMLRLQRLFTHFICKIILPDWELKVLKSIKPHALRSAVAAIMSRNMSHNIGSHVLNYLSNPEELDSLWII